MFPANKSQAGFTPGVSGKTAVLEIQPLMLLIWLSIAVAVS